jgi:site-specific DNA recombinase
MQALLAAAQQGAFNIVIVWALSRFTRSVQDMYVTLDLLQRSNVDFRSHTESFDTSTAIGRAMLGIVGVFAQMEREITSERVKAAARERVEQGYPPLNYVIGYRRCCKELIIVEDEAEVVRYIYQMYLRHKCLSAVSDLCAERGYHGKLGARITAWQAKRILTNPIYVGKLRFKCETYQGTHEPIINPQDWQRVQKLLAKSPRTPRGKR